MGQSLAHELQHVDTCAARLGHRQTAAGVLGWSGSRLDSAGDPPGRADPSEDISPLARGHRVEAGPPGRTWGAMSRGARSPGLACIRGRGAPGPGGSLCPPRRGYRTASWVGDAASPSFLDTVGITRPSERTPGNCDLAGGSPL